MDIIVQRLIIGFGISLIFGIIAFMREMVDDQGFFTGVILFTSTYVFLDWQAFAIIIAFFMISGISINIENRDKAQKGEFELYKAKRTIERVLGRCLAGAIFGGLFFITNRPEFKLAFVASYAESIFDTVSTKLGKLLSKDAVLITGLKRVHRGTPGAVSLQGTLLGLLAGLTLCVVAVFSRLISLNGVFAVLVGASIGSAIDSILNGYSYQKRYVPNEFINFFSSASAGIVCIFIQWFLTVVLYIG